MKATIAYKTPKTILTKGTGFLSGYSHSLNPYTGCAFGCSYCYVREMPVSAFRSEEWGSWVDVKQGAAELLDKEITRAKKKGPVTIFMSSSTDPYQPAEHSERITRSLLEAMAVNQPDFLFVQTRSPLAARDADVFQELGKKVRISMTVETDSEVIRKHFTPSAPPIPARLNALRELKEAGIPVQATIAPLLPSSRAFPELLSPIVSRICIDDYFMGDGSGGRRTEKIGIPSLYEELNLKEWYNRTAYRKLYKRFTEVFSQEQILISKEGFLPG
jgi:DNA repair photolyase